MYSDEWRTLGNFSFMGLWKHRALQLPYYRRRKLIKQYQKSPSLLTSPSVFCGSHYFFCISIFPFFFFRHGEGAVKERGEKHGFVVSLIYAFIGWFLYVPWLSMESSSTLEYLYYSLTKWTTWPGPLLSFFVCFFNSHQWICLLTLEREEGGERERERNITVKEKHQPVASCTCPCQGWNPQPMYVPWPGIGPTTF